MKTERVKIAFQFILMIICSFIIGILLERTLSADFYESSVLRVSGHFETLFINCSVLYDYVECILLYSLSDMICIVLLFLVSFAAFNYVVTDLILVYIGAKFGLSVSFLANFISNDTYAYNIGLIRYAVFVIFNLFVLTLILGYSYKAAVSSFGLKKTGADGRPNIKMRSLLSFLIYTLANIGSVLILNGIYCWLIYILK